MVTAAAPRPTRRGIWLVVIAAALITLAGPAAPVLAQPDSGGTYGFNDDCEALHDTLDGFGIPGTPFNLGNFVGGTCKAGNAATHPNLAIDAIRDKAWDSTFGKAVDSLLNGLGQMIIMSLTFWTRVPNSSIANSPDLFAKVRDYTLWLQVNALIISMVLCGARLAIARARAASEEATETFRVLARTAFAAFTFSSVLVVATRASDSFADWVISDAAGGNAKAVAEAMIETKMLTGFSPGLVLILGIVGMLGALAQLVFAILRLALLPLVVGVLPIAAAGSGFQHGSGLYSKLIAWSIAFVLWKPIAALVYMVAFVTAGVTQKSAPDAPVDPESAQRVLVGIVLLCSAGFVLPALMRLISPAVATGTSRIPGAGGLLANATSAAILGRNIATGARNSRGGGRVPTGTPRPAGRPPTGSAAGRAPSPASGGVPRAAGPAGAAGARGAAGAATRGGTVLAGPAGAAIAGGLIAAKALHTAGRSAAGAVEAAATASPHRPPPTGTRGMVPR